MTRALTAAFAALPLALTGAAAMADEPQTITIEEWDIPWENTRPRDPYTIDAETIWFVGQQGHYLAHLNAATGELTRYELQPGDGPHNLIVDADGIVWYAGNRAAHIGRFDPQTQEFERIATPQDTARDPHTLVFDANGDIWFTAQGANSIGRLTLEGRGLDIIPVPTERSRPYGIDIAPDGMVWSVLFGTNKLAAVDPETLELTEYEIPRAEARPRRLAITSDGRVWYVDYAAGYLGAYDPRSGEFAEWAAPSGAQSRPYAMAVDDEDRLWFAESGVSPNLFVGFDPATESFFSVTPVPSGGGTLRHMQYFAPTGEIWFGADTHTIGRAIVQPGRR
ncbi:MAG: lyase [Maricaulaceae bacterium]|nr:lyase [Maricaulaceae bacterium]